MNSYYCKFVRKDLEEFYEAFFPEAKQKMFETLETIKNTIVIVGNTKKDNSCIINNTRLLYFVELATAPLYPSFYLREVGKFLLKSNTMVDQYYHPGNRWYGQDILDYNVWYSRYNGEFRIPLDCVYIHDFSVDPLGQYYRILYAKYNVRYYNNLLRNIKALEKKNNRYFLNLKTNECSCKSYKYRNYCKHYKIAFKYKAELFRGMCLVLSQYTSLGCAMDIVDDFMFG